MQRTFLRPHAAAACEGHQRQQRHSVTAIDGSAAIDRRFHVEWLQRDVLVRGVDAAVYHRRIDVVQTDFMAATKVADYRAVLLTPP